MAPPPSGHRILTMIDISSVGVPSGKQKLETGRSVQIIHHTKVLKEKVYKPDMIMSYNV